MTKKTPQELADFYHQHIAFETSIEPDGNERLSSAYRTDEFPELSACYAGIRTSLGFEAARTEISLSDIDTAAAVQALKEVSAGESSSERPEAIHSLIYSPQDASLRVCEPDARIIAYTQPSGSTAELQCPRNLGPLVVAEYAGRKCYRSISKMTGDSFSAFLGSAVRRGHESVLEHASITVELNVSRAIQLEIVRHRIAAYSWESTRYCGYGDGKKFEMTFARPYWMSRRTADLITDGLDSGSAPARAWVEAQLASKRAYESMILSGMQPQAARGVLSNDLMSTGVVTYNLREWRHFLKLRHDKWNAHPDIYFIADKILRGFVESGWSAVFDPEDFGGLAEDGYSGCLQCC